MDTEISHSRKRKTKRKLRLFRALTVIFVLLFIAAAGFAIYKSASSAEEIKGLKKQISQMQSEISVISAEKYSLQTELSDLSTQHADLTERYNKINIDTQAFQASIASMQSQIDLLTTEKTDIQAELETVSKNLETVKNTNSSLSDRNASLARQVSSLNSTVTTLKDENKALREAFASINTPVPSEGGTDEGDEKIIEEGPEMVSSGKIAYLTFDDGVSKYTNDILDILARYGVKATFFPNWKGSSNEKYQRIVEEGHAIGNHTYSHEYEDVYSTLDGFISEVTKLNTKIEEATGYTPVIFRFPGGSNNTVHKKYNTEIIQQAIKALSDLGMKYYDWNVNSGDADSSKGASKETILNNVLNRATMDKAVVLMHDTNTKGTTVQALPEIIEGLIAKGYSFGVLTDPDAPVVQSVKPQS